MRLLLIEDDKVLANSLKQQLARQGYAVDWTDNGVDGEFMGEQEPYDIVVLDLGLPQRPGLDVLQNWRHKGNNVPVIVLTARDTWHERVDGLKAGADDYLGKPFHVEELNARILSLVKRSHNKPGFNVSSDGLTLDEDTQQIITSDGEQIELTGTEFRLLRYFMLHPKKVLSKTRLTEHIYEQNFDRDSNVIEVYVRKLREKLGKDIIQTRRGQGYVFMAKER